MFRVIVFVLSFLAFSFFSADSIKAKVSTPPGQLKRQEMKLKVEEKKASIEAKVVQTRNDKIRNFWIKMKKLLLSIVDRLNKLITRIESRIDKIKDNNEDINTSKIEAQLVSAKKLISDATLKINNIDADLETSLSSNDPKKSFKDLLQKIKTVRNDLKSAHKILVHVIGDIKGLRVGSSDDKDNDGSPTITLTPTLTSTPTPTLTPTPTPTTVPTESPTPTP